MTEQLPVAVLGAHGRMGAEAVKAVEAASDMKLVAALGRGDSLDTLSSSGARIVVDLTVPESTEANVRFAVEHGMHAVVGTTGWDAGRIAELRSLLSGKPEVGVLIAPNFALGSVLASAFAAKASKYFESVEIIELHHPDKVDAPSGTAVRTAQLIAGERAHAERREYGVDHAVIGGVLMRRWRLPQVIAHAVERHHAPDADGEAAILALADGLARYELGENVRPAELESAAARVGLDTPALESLMYRLPERGGRPRRTVAKSPLSKQEREVLKGLAASKVYKEIAHDLGIAASTVRSHLHNVYAKLGAADRAQAVLIASREGWI